MQYFMQNHANFAQRDPDISEAGLSNFMRGRVYLAMLHLNFSEVDDKISQQNVQI